MSQCQQILDYIKANGSIQPKQAWAELGVYRLASRISDLRSAGFNIQTNINKNGKHRFAIYTLEDL